MRAVEWNPNTPFPKVGSQGFPVLLIPGTWCNARVWESQIAALESAGLYAIAVDTTSFVSIDACTMAILAQAPSAFSVAGFSSGGYYAFDLIRRSPDRVDRLALVDTQATPVDEQTEKPQTLEMLNQAGAAPLESVVAGILPALVADPEQEGLKKTILLMAKEVGVEGLANQVEALIQRMDSVPSLATITQPALVVAGEHDALIPAIKQREMASNIPNSKFVQLDGVGHMTPLEASNELSALFADWFAVN